MNEQQKFQVFLCDVSTGIVPVETGEDGLSFEEARDAVASYVEVLEECVERLTPALDAVDHDQFLRLAGK